MTRAIGRVDQISRYPVKSMAGSRLTEARLGWHGLEGDRRFAFRRRAVRGGMPWLTGSRLPELILHRPCDGAGADAGAAPTHVRTPDGRILDLWSQELAGELGQRFEGGVELMELGAGIFDEAPVSVLARSTVGTLETESGRSLDLRRFRANLVLATVEEGAFVEDAWVGRSLRFGAEPEAATVAITLRDLRCVMINLDPDTAAADASIMKTAVRLNDNFAGVYGIVLSPGTIRVGQEVFLVEATGPC